MSASRENRHRVKRPKSNEVCAHCRRDREPRHIEWHPGIEEWQCSDFDDCDRAMRDRRTKVNNDSDGDLLVVVSSNDLAAAIKNARKEAFEGRDSALGKAKQRISNKIITLTKGGECTATLSVAALNITQRVLYEHVFPWLKAAGVEAIYCADQRDGDYIQVTW